MQQAVIYQKLKLIQKQCRSCVSFSDIWVCTNCKQNYCLDHLFGHFRQCQRGVCYMPQQNVFYCFSCDEQVLSYHLRSQHQLQAFQQLSKRFTKYRSYSLISYDNLPKLPNQTDACVQTDLEDVVFVSEGEAQQNNIYQEVKRPGSLQEHFLDVQRQNQEIILRQQEQLEMLTQQIHSLGGTKKREKAETAAVTSQNEPKKKKELDSDHPLPVEAAPTEPPPPAGVPPSDSMVPPSDGDVLPPEQGGRKKKKRNRGGAESSTADLPPPSETDMPPPSEDVPHDVDSSATKKKRKGKKRAE